MNTNDVVTVTVQTAAAAAQGRSFNKALILGLSTVLPLYSLTQEYQASDLATIGTLFGTSSEEYKIAAVYFSQSPQPQSVKIGRRFIAAQSGQLRGAGVSATPLATFQAVTNGGFDVALNGTNYQVTALNLSGAASMAAIATLIQTKLVALLASTTCTYNGAQFIITSPTTGTASTVGYAVAPTGGGAPTDASTLLGFSSASGAQAFQGIAIETMTDSLNGSVTFDPNFYGILLAGASTQDHKDTMAFAEAGTYLFSFTVIDPTAKLAATTTDLLSYAQTNTYKNSFGTWSASAYAGASALARLLVVDLTQPNSAITLKFKQLPGIAADVLSATEVAALRGKNANFYTGYAATGSSSNFAMYADGKCGSGAFIDQVFNLAWAQAQLQLAYFNALATNPTKVAQTDSGMQQIIQPLDKVMAGLRSAGVIAPGNWAGTGLGEIATGDYLPAAFYTYTAPISSLSSANRAARQASPISIIATGSGAIHTGSVLFTFQA